MVGKIRCEEVLFFNNQVLDVAKHALRGGGGQIAVKPATLAVALPAHTKTLQGIETRGNWVKIFLVEDKLAHAVDVALRDVLGNVAMEVGTGKFGRKDGEYVIGRQHSYASHNALALSRVQLVSIDFKEHTPVKYVAQGEFELGSEVADCVHEEIDEIAHGAETALGGNVAERGADIAFSAALAAIVEVKKVEMVFDLHTIDSDFGVLAVKGCIGTAEEGIAALVVLLVQGQEKDVDIATRTGTRVGIVARKGHTLDKSEGHAAVGSTRTEALKHLRLMLVVVACALGRERPAKGDIALGLLLRVKPFGSIVEHGDNAVLAGQPEELCPLLLVGGQDIGGNTIKRVTQKRKHLLGCQIHVDRLLEEGDLPFSPFLNARDIDFVFAAIGSDIGGDEMDIDDGGGVALIDV